VGLHNTLQRLKTLYDDAYLFDISLRKRGGLRISIKIPYDPVISAGQGSNPDSPEISQ